MNKLFWHKDVDWEDVIMDFIMFPIMLVALVVCLMITVALIISVPFSAWLVLNMTFRYHWAYCFLLILEYPLIGMTRYAVRFMDSLE